MTKRDDAYPEPEAIEADFEFLDDWDDRYRYIIDLGRSLPPYPDDKRDETHKVRGCVSQVWLSTETDGSGEPILIFRGDSDAHIVRGLVAIVLSLFSGRSPEDVQSVDAEGFMGRLGLEEHLTPQRANGLRAMVGRIREEASSRLQTG